MGNDGPLIPQERQKRSTRDITLQEERMDNRVVHKPGKYAGVSMLQGRLCGGEFTGWIYREARGSCRIAESTRGPETLSLSPWTEGKGMSRNEKLVKR